MLGKKGDDESIKYSMYQRAINGSEEKSVGSEYLR